MLPSMGITSEDAIDTVKTSETVETVKSPLPLLVSLTSVSLPGGAKKKVFLHSFDLQDMVYLLVSLACLSLSLGSEKESVLRFL